MHLVKNGISPFSIVLPKNAPAAERYAASELSHFLARMTGAELPVTTEAAPKIGPEILIGYGKRTEALGLSPENTPAEEEYQILAKNGDLVIAGGQPRGTLYGVYGFLQDVLGFRFFAHGCTKIPASKDVELDDTLSLSDKPDFRYRDTDYVHANEGIFAARLRQNGALCALSEEHGGHHKYAPGFFVHTFYNMLPPSEYYAEHPEYFALVNGRRTDEPHGKTCMTNPEVLQICTEKVLKALRENPDATLISVSQNDGMEPCECDECRRVVEHEGGESGPIIHFVNAVADEVAKEFPHVIVDTLAYAYSSTPPRHVRPRENVQIRLCSYDCCFTHPMGTCDWMPSNCRFEKEHSIFPEELVGWGKLTKRLAIWDYVVDFEFYNQMHPNLHALGPNMRFFKEHNVDSVFSESPAGGYNCEMAELRAYLLARLMWDVDFDTDEGIREFCDEWFGPASGAIQAFLSMTKEALLASGWHMNLFDNPNAPYITADLLKKADELFDEAEKTVENDPVRLHRVRKERLAVRFSKFFLPEFVFEDRAAAVDAYMADAVALGVTRFSAKWGKSNTRQLALRGVWPPHEDDREVIQD